MIVDDEYYLISTKDSWALYIFLQNSTKGEIQIDGAGVDANYD